MHNIKFSVIIPNHNHAKFLKERIDSVCLLYTSPSPRDCS